MTSKNKLFFSKIFKINAFRKAHLQLFAALFFLLLSFTLVSRTLAQEQNQQLNLTVSPPVIELVAKPGEVVIEKFRVRNNANQPIVLQIEARRLISDPTEGNPIPENEAKGEELSWVTFDRPEFTANPLEWQDITFTINIPENAAYGYYYVFKISPKNEANIKTTGAAIQGELLVVTLLNVLQDGATSKTELVEFKAKSMVNEYLPVDFSVMLKNLGNIHVKPQGNIFITRGGGQEIGTLEVNPNVGSILPSGTREFEASWSDGFLVHEPVIENDIPVLDSNGNPTTKLKINWDRLTSFRFGPYEARLLMVYDDGEKDVPLEAVATFWVIPYKAIGLMIIALIIVGFAIRFILKWYVGQAIKKSKSR